MQSPTESRDPATTTPETTMKAIVRRKYGTPEVLELHDVPKPDIEDDRVLVRIHAASVNPMEWHLMTGTPFLARAQAGFFKPKRTTLGVDLAGRVEAVGKNVTEFKPGDEVFGESWGAYAEYVSAGEDQLVRRPENVTAEEAAAVSVAAITALQGLRDKGQIRPGQKVLVNGASGGVGTFAVQIAKALGAEVTAVCSTRNVEMVRTIGADHVVDYTKEDFTRGESEYDLFLDAVGNRSLPDCRRIMKTGGIYVAVGGPKTSLGLLGRMFRMMAVSMVGRKKMLTMLARTNKADLEVLRELLEAGKVKSVIDRRYPLAATRDAMTYQGEGHAQGKTIITI